MKSVRQTTMHGVYQYKNILFIYWQRWKYVTDIELSNNLFDGWWCCNLVAVVYQWLLNRPIHNQNDKYCWYISHRGYTRYKSLCLLISRFVTPIRGTTRIDPLIGSLYCEWLRPYNSVPTTHSNLIVPNRPSLSGLYPANFTRGRG